MPKAQCAMLNAPLEGCLVIEHREFRVAIEH
jgi:hypothetical protein